MTRTIIAVSAVALSTAALAQVGTDPVDNKGPGRPVTTDRAGFARH